MKDVLITIGAITVGAVIGRAAATLLIWIFKKALTFTKSRIKKIGL